ncbi:MAG: type II toxin-antitoxin system PemK/MazF family toxin [Kineosporiaceae bacterium]
MAGEIVEVDLGHPIDPEAGLLHPALIVSSARFDSAPLRIVCPITTTRRDYPYRIELEPDDQNNLRQTSYVQVEHVRSVSTARLRRTTGRIDGVRLLQVQRVLSLLLDLRF